MTNPYFNDLHNLAEPSYKEYKTTEYIQAHINKDFEVTPLNETGLIATKLGTSGITIGIRSDMDALTFFNNDNGKYYRHSCGHDAHMSILLSVLNNMPETKHTYKFIFQPAEEMGTGAAYVVESGVLDDVDYLFGMHLRPLEELSLGEMSSGIQHGANASVHITIRTTPAHAARPFQGSNAIGISHLIYSQLKELHFDMDNRVLINVTQLNTHNDNTNSIPGHVSMMLDIRAKTNEDMDNALSEVKDMIMSLNGVQGSEIECIVSDRVYAAIINKEAKELLTQAILSTSYEWVDTIVTAGAEDFHMYTKLRPNIKAVLLGIGCDMNHGLHHPNMTFNVDALENATEVFLNLVHQLEKSSLSSNR